MRSIQRTQKKEERKRELAYIYGVGATDGRSNTPKDPKKVFGDPYCQVAYDLGYERCADEISKSSDEIIEMVEKRISGTLAPNKTKPNPDRINILNLKYEVMWDVYFLVLIGGIVLGVILNYHYYDEYLVGVIPEWLSLIIISLISFLGYCALINLIANGNPIKSLKKYKFDGEEK